MSLKQTIAPTNLPVDIDSMRSHRALIHVDDDSLLTGLLGAATDYGEARLDRQFITATWRLKCDGFPSVDYIELPRPPLQSVTSVKYIDTDGDEQTFSSSLYTVDTDSEPGRIVLNYDEDWPDTRNQHQSVEIVFVAGYGDNPANVPTVTRQALELLVGHWYENREASIVGPKISVVPFAVDHCFMATHWGRYP